MLIPYTESGENTFLMYCHRLEMYFGEGYPPSISMYGYTMYIRTALTHPLLDVPD